MEITTSLLFHREINMNESHPAGAYKEQLPRQSVWQVSQYREGETNLHLPAFLLAQNRCSLACPLLRLLSLCELNPLVQHGMLHPLYAPAQSLAGNREISSLRCFPDALTGICIGTQSSAYQPHHGQGRQQS